MARSLKNDEAEDFKNAISPERKLTEEISSFEGLIERRDEELELSADSAFWLGGHIPGATNS
jgi:hypothetical protein